MSAIKATRNPKDDENNEFNTNQNAPVINPDDLKPETLERLERVINATRSLLTEAEKEWNEEKKKRQIDAEKKYMNTLEEWSKRETFEIPSKSGTTYQFIGYNNQQYKDIMKTGNEADQIENKRSPEYIEKQIQVYKDTVRFSLQHMKEEILDKLPKRELKWLYLVMKDKNENPLPFEVNA